MQVLFPRFEGLVVRDLAILSALGRPLDFEMNGIDLDRLGRNSSYLPGQVRKDVIDTEVMLARAMIGDALAEEMGFHFRSNLRSSFAGAVEILKTDRASTSLLVERYLFNPNKRRRLSALLRRRG